MTAIKKLKQRIRAPMAKTGESYTATRPSDGLEPLQEAVELSRRRREAVRRGNAGDTAAAAALDARSLRNSNRVCH